MPTAMLFAMATLVIVSASLVIPAIGAVNNQAYLPYVVGPAPPTATPITQWAPWPMYQHDAAHTARSAYVAATAPAVRWIFSDSSIYLYAVTPPIVAPDGTVYVGADTLASTNPIYAINPDGTLRWKLIVPGIVSGVAVGPDGTVYVNSDCAYPDNTTASVYALTPSGSVKWRYLAVRCGIPPPVVDGLGKIYVESLVLNPDGSRAWQSSLGTSSPAIGGNGEIYIGGSALYAPRSGGALDWSYPAALLSPTLGPDGVIYGGGPGEWMYAINPNGALRWQYALPNNSTGIAAVAPDGTIYAQTAYGVIAFDRNGTVKWQYANGTHIASAPVIGSDGTIYFYSNSSGIFALNPDGSVRWQSSFPDGLPPLPPAIGADGTIYLSSEGSRILYALGASQKPPIIR